jgi:ribonucleoside-diphosphate reductase alpha chain
MDPIEALTEAPPKDTREAATAPDAAAWLHNPTNEADTPTGRLRAAIQQIANEAGIDLSAPACHNCGSITQRTGSCYTCATCGTSGGCA